MAKMDGCASHATAQEGNSLEIPLGSEADSPGNDSRKAGGVTLKDRIIELIRTTDWEISKIAKFVGSDIRYARHVANRHYELERKKMREKLWAKPRPEPPKIDRDETNKYAGRVFESLTCDVQRARWIAFLKAHRDVPPSAPAEMIVHMAEKHGPPRAQKQGTRCG
jgi:hypothetical protein